MTEVVFVPVKDNIASQEDDWYVLSGVQGINCLEQQKKLTAANLSASQAEQLCVMARLAVNRYKEVNLLPIEHTS
jgi:hypothetical protein